MSSGLDQQSEHEFVVMRTKLMVPEARSRQIPRPELVDALEAGRAAKLTLVCAPTGWGKTSLMAEWAARCTVPFAWVSLDAGDAEPLRFWRYVVAALASVAPPLVATAQRRLRAPVVSIDEEILPVLVNDLAETEALVLVLDDYHLISAAEVHKQLSYLLDHLPAGVHVVIGARTDPPLHLGRLRAAGQLAELRGEQLRFGDDEAAALLNRIYGLELDPDQITTVQARLEGWVAGLNLAALSLRQRGDPHAILEALPVDDRYLVDYLWKEVVLSEPAPVREFLTHTAILERLSGPLCDVVAQRSGSARLLRELEAANLFIVPLDRERNWFRYHNLFRSLLHDQLQRSAPDAVADLHRRASTWYASAGFPSEAIDHAILAGDVHYAADEIETHWLEFYSAGRADRLLSWIDHLPADVIDALPTLALVRAGVGRAMGRTEEVEPWLQRAERSGGDTPARGFGTTVAAGAAMSRAMYQLALGDVPGAIDMARRAAALEVPGSRAHATAGYFLGVALFYDDAQASERLLQAYLEAVPDGQEDARRYYAIALLAEAHAVRGELEAASRLASQALNVARRQQLEEHPPTEQVHVALGIVALERGELDAAEDELERAVRLARRGGDRLEVAHALVWLARFRARRGEADQGQDALAVARNLLPELGDSAMRSLVRALEAELAARQPAEPGPVDGDPVSEAELRVLRLLSGDLSYREIGQHLHLSLNTVRTHALHLRHKLGASTRIGVVARARERGLL
ncbi:MAG: tetratricopeptide repeat protein [Solirubrobacterales bacterium]|nr:tetratricopeptide repeat protein [Solirubrobacterales bacterium]